MKSTVILLITFSFLLYGCAAAPVKEEAKPEVKPGRKSAIPQKEQEKKSAEVFRELLNITSSAPKREDVLPEIEKKYLEIIRNYPDAPLAQESYYRLISLFLRDYYPPEFNKAELHYNNFLREYPGSKHKFRTDRILASSYHKSQQWDKLSEVTRAYFNKYSRTGSSNSPQLLFMYAESNYRLGNIKEAEVGYKAVVKLFPNFSDGITSKSRLNEIDAIKSK